VKHDTGGQHTPNRVNLILNSNTYP